MPAPTVSLIVPAYNNQAYLPQLLASIQAQTSHDYELIIVDDGSTDDTARIADEAAGDFARCRALHQKNSGPGVARNTGLAHAQGAYVLFLDADDVVDGHLVEHAAARAKETDADIVVFKMRLFDMGDGRYHPLPDQWDATDYAPEFNPADYPETLFDAFKNWPPDKLFRRQFLQDNHIAFPALYRTEDMAFTCTALCCARTIALLDEELYTYRVNNLASSTQTTDRAPLDFYTSACILQEQLQERGLLDAFRTTFDRWVSLCIEVNMLALKTPDAFFTAYDALHDGGIAKLGLEQAKREDFPQQDRYDFVRMVLDNDSATGTFLIWKREMDKLKEAHNRDTARIMSSSSFKLGSKLLKPLTAIKDRNDRP